MEEESLGKPMEERKCMLLNFFCILLPEGFPCIQLVVGHLECHSQLKDKIVHIHSKFLNEIIPEGLYMFKRFL